MSKILSDHLKIDVNITHKLRIKCRIFISLKSRKIRSFYANIHIHTHI